MLYMPTASMSSAMPSTASQSLCGFGASATHETSFVIERKTSRPPPVGAA